MDPARWQAARELFDQLVDLAPRRLRITPGGFDQAGSHALFVIEQRLQKMRRRDPLLMLPNGDRLGCLEEAARAVGELFKIHLLLPLVSSAPIWCCR